MSSKTKILIVYHSMQGHTKRMAEAVADGTRSVDGTYTLLKSVDEAQRTDLQDCDALILGCPVHQRTVSWEMKQFIDRQCEPSWFYDDMVGRVGGVFTTGGGHGNCGAGCEMAQLSMLANLASMGAILVTLPKTVPGFDSAGMHWGPHIRTNNDNWESPPPEQMNSEGLKAAYHHGANIARIAVALSGATLMAKENVSPPTAVRQIRTQLDGTFALGNPR